MLTSVVVDIDDTLINTARRMQAIWQIVLGRDIPLEAIETLGIERIFKEFASHEQQASASEFQKRFWDIVLCMDKVGIELLKLDEPIPFAAGILQEWSRHCSLVYLTGRTENTRKLTLSELENFGFPTVSAQLTMFNLEDYAKMRGENLSGPSLIDAKARLLSSISRNYSVVRVVDDLPAYFPVYKRFNIPDRIGLLHARRYAPQQYIAEGATRVVESWRQLQDDSPKLT